MFWDCEVLCVGVVYHLNALCILASAILVTVSLDFTASFMLTLISTKSSSQPFEFLMMSAIRSSILFAVIPEPGLRSIAATRARMKASLLLQGIGLMLSHVPSLVS